MYQFAPCKCLFPFKFCHIFIQIIKIIRMIPNVLTGRDHKSKSAACGVVAALTWLRCDKPCHDIDQHTGCEVLTSTGFLLICIFLQKAFVKIAESFLLCREPVKTIDGRDDLFQICRFINIAGSASVDFLDASGSFFAEFLQKFIVEFLQIGSVAPSKFVPAILLWYIFLGTGFLCHLQKKNIGKLCHVLMICNAVIPEYVAEIPKFLNDVMCSHADLPPSSYKYPFSSRI